MLNFLQVMKTKNIKITIKVIINLQEAIINNLKLRNGRFGNYLLQSLRIENQMIICFLFHLYLLILTFCKKK